MSIEEHLSIAQQHRGFCRCESCMSVVDEASEHRFDRECAFCRVWLDRVLPDDEDAA